jgi:hypothetical protein
MRLIDLKEQRFGRLVVVAPHPKRSRGGYAFWRCRCSCGAETIVIGNDLRAGKTRSCGCLRRETTRKRLTTHGHAPAGNCTRIYQIWCAMLQRCRNPNNRDYRNYGARGITVCDRWLSFVNFLIDMGEPPPGMSIDRIDVNSHYEPRNCKWSTTSEQNRNRRPFKQKKRRAKLTEIQAYAAALRGVNSAGLTLGAVELRE